MWIVKLRSPLPYTFGPVCTGTPPHQPGDPVGARPVDIFPNIISLVSVIWNLFLSRACRMGKRIVSIFERSLTTIVNTSSTASNPSR